MRPPIRFELVLVATFWVCGGFGLYGQAQAGSPHCSADGSPRDENGRPHCCPDGSPPDGESQCWCDLTVVHLREYRNPEHDYEVQVPDGIAEILAGCGGTGTGFKISLTHPDTGESEGLPNMIWVGRGEPTAQTLQEMADHWSRYQKEDSEGIHATDLQIAQPAPTSLSSLNAIHEKATRAEPNRGTMLQEVIVAKSPDEYVYAVGMITPADQYEKNLKLFKAIVDGFRYVSSGRAASQ